MEKSQLPVSRGQVKLALTGHVEDSYLYLKGTGKPTKAFKRGHYLSTLAVAWRMGGMGVVRERQGVTWK